MSGVKYICMCATYSLVRMCLGQWFRTIQTWCTQLRGWRGGSCITVRGLTWRLPYFWIQYFSHGRLKGRLMLWLTSCPTKWKFEQSISYSCLDLNSEVDVVSSQMFSDVMSWHGFCWSFKIVIFNWHTIWYNSKKKNVCLSKAFGHNESQKQTQFSKSLERSG